MSNLEKYKKAFVVAFDVNESEVEGLEYQSIVEWDSVGHMALIAELEECFEIEIDAEHVIEFSSFKKGKEILEKYKVIF